jgi:nitrogenase subunit NifH
MVTDTDGYIHIIEYLTEHLSLFENLTQAEFGADTVIAVIEKELSEQIIMVCAQNEQLSFNQRNTIIREVDAIVYDLEEILSGVINNPVSNEQLAFLKEFALLIKNLFDNAIYR